MANRGARIALSGSVVRTKKDKGYLAEMAFVPCHAGPAAPPDQLACCI